MGGGGDGLRLMRTERLQMMRMVDRNGERYLTKLGGGKVYATNVSRKYHSRESMGARNR